jgi:hypothetical protein
MITTTMVLIEPIPFPVYLDLLSDAYWKVSVANRKSKSKCYLSHIYRSQRSKP